MTTVFFIRHAEAEGNLFRRGQGQFDGKITPRGRRQIEALAERFRDIHLDALYSSDMSRTIETAGAVLKYHDLELHTTERLREINMGIWEDMSWGDITYEYPEQMYSFNADPDTWYVEGCETFAHLTQRMRAALFDIAAMHDGQTIALVSHGMAIRALLSSIIGANEITHGDNTAVALLEVAGEDVKISMYNDNSHLCEEISTFARQTWWKDEGGIEENNLRFELLYIEREDDFYLRCYADSWRISHGSEQGFEPESYLRSARQHAALYPRALMKAVCGDKTIGIVELDTEKCKEEDCGWLTLCYLLPETRGRKLGVQLIGHAMAELRRLGRSALRLHVAADNTNAVGFYEYCGFVELKREQGKVGQLIMMERTL